MAGSIEQYSASIAIACIIGSALSVYSYYLISTLEEDDEYEALFDFGERLSCTKTLQSEYVHIFHFKSILLNLFVFHFIVMININSHFYTSCVFRIFFFLFFFFNLFAAMHAVSDLLHHYSVVTHFSTSPTDYTPFYSTQSNHC